MAVRLMKNEDIQECVEMALDMHQESFYSQFEINTETLYYLADRAVADDSYFGAVSTNYNYNGDIITGMMVGFLAPMWFSNSATTACDIALYLKPEYRGGLSAIRLIKAFDDWAVSKNASVIQMGVSTNVNPERTSNLYTRLGYKPEVPINRRIV